MEDAERLLEKYEPHESVKRALEKTNRRQRLRIVKIDEDAPFLPNNAKVVPFGV